MLNKTVEKMEEIHEKMAYFPSQLISVSEKNQKDTLTETSKVSSINGFNRR